MIIKKLSIVLLVFLMVLFMGILICVGLLFGDDSEGNSSIGLFFGGSNVFLEVLKYCLFVEKYVKELDILEYVLIFLVII